MNSIRDLVICCLELCVLSISNYGVVSSEQVNEFLEHFCRTCIQCNFNERYYFAISFTGVKIPKLFDYQFINPKKISIDLNPSWYTNESMGFWISYNGISLYLDLEATFVYKSNPKRKYSLKYRTYGYLRLEDPSICCCYIPFERLWQYASGNKKGKNPNDYYMFELSQLYPDKNKQVCWGTCVKYEKEVMTDIGHQKQRRKIRVMQMFVYNLHANEHIFKKLLHITLIRWISIL